MLISSFDILMLFNSQYCGKNKYFCEPTNILNLIDAIYNKFKINL